MAAKGFVMAVKTIGFRRLVKWFGAGDVVRFFSVVWESGMTWDLSSALLWDVPSRSSHAICTLLVGAVLSPSLLDSNHGVGNLRFESGSAGLWDRRLI